MAVAVEDGQLDAGQPAEGYYGDDYPDKPRKHNVSWLGRIVYGLDDAINLVSKLNLEGRKFLTGNYAPVSKELEAADLECINGALPSTLSGAYARIGPNPVFEPKGGYHWFDGDGMVHAVRFKDGKASYANRFVKTETMRVELEAGFPKCPKIGDLGNRLGLLALVMKEALWSIEGKPRGVSRANTAMVFHAKRLLALEETNMPYRLRMLCSGVVETVGLVMEDKVGKKPFTAHPKVDPTTGDMSYFSYDVMRRPHLTVGFMDAAGGSRRTIPLNDVKRPVMIHDMAVTKSYAIIYDAPLVFDKMMKTGQPFAIHSDIPTRFGLVPKNAVAESEVTWVEDPVGCWLTHTVNAWDDDESKDVIVIAVRVTAIDLMALEPSSDDEKRDTIAMWTLNPKTKEAIWKRIIPKGLHGEFPVIHPAYVGKKNRFFWFAENESKTSVDQSDRSSIGLFVNIVKIDLQLAIVDSEQAVIGRISFGDHVRGGEMTFVPKVCNDCNWVDGAEDDGYLLGYHHNEETNVSYFVVYDAKTMDPQPVCKFKMPHRVPYGFHGLYLNEDEFKAQLEA